MSPICIQAKLNPSFYDYLGEKYNLPQGVEAVLIGKGEGIGHAAGLITDKDLFALMKDKHFAIGMKSSITSFPEPKTGASSVFAKKPRTLNSLDPKVTT